MSGTWKIGAGVLGLAILSSAAPAQWLDNFDGYSPGPLAAQSVWEEWTGSSGVDADVTTSESLSAPHSVEILSDNDVVYDFVNLSGGRPTSGKWIASIKVYTPSGMSGTGWFIMLDTYPSPLHWAVQFGFNGATGKIENGFIAGDKRNLKYDRWMSLVVAIDLDNDRYDAWYGDKLVTENASYTRGSGALEAAVVDLYGATGFSGLYFDDIRLEKGFGGPLVLNAQPNPVGVGQTLEIYSHSPVVQPGNLGALLTWSINGVPFVQPLFFPVFSSTLDWTISAPVPSGLSGLAVGFKAMAVPSSGPVMLSNEEVVVFN
jgi:hypothetical protein